MGQGRVFLNKALILRTDDEIRNAGFFLYIDLSPYLPASKKNGAHGEYEKDFALAEKLLDGGVGLHPCE